MNEERFLCERCGGWHSGPPMSWDVEAPAYWPGSRGSIKAESNFLDSDFCAIEDNDFFIKGNLEIPVQGLVDKFVWCVWVSLSNVNFERARTLVHEPARTREPSYFGWLSSSLPIYPETLKLKTNVHTRAVGIRPFVELERTVHPLAIEQREGITMARVREIATLMHHQ
jgi:hypothetical protein